MNWLEDDLGDPTWLGVKVWMLRRTWGKLKCWSGRHAWQRPLKDASLTVSAALDGPISIGTGDIVYRSREDGGSQFGYSIQQYDPEWREERGLAPLNYSAILSGIGPLVVTPAPEYPTITSVKVEYDKTKRECARCRITKEA